LVVHGLLHLLGYDDSTPEDREAMWKRQEALVRAFRGHRI
jgi:rRNA maturation RNase YbeY